MPHREENTRQEGTPDPGTLKEDQTKRRQEKAKKEKIEFPPCPFVTGIDGGRSWQVGHIYAPAGFLQKVSRVRG